jgi:protein-S-isoprenylcysteine O-methyltransferase Ste14
MLVMAEHERDRAAIAAPPPLLTILCIVGGFVADHFRPFPFIHAMAWLRYGLCLALSILAGAVIFSGIRQLRKHDEHPSPYKPTDSIVGSGIYRFTRNPIYLGFLIVVLAVGVGANSAWFSLSLVVLFVVLTVGVVKPEERYLSMKFGDRYDEYRRRVRRWL